jgi:hypothetical protein
MTPPSVPPTPRYLGEVEAALRLAVVKQEGLAARRNTMLGARSWQLRAVSPLAALIVLMVLGGPMMLRAANVATAPVAASADSVTAPALPDSSSSVEGVGPVDLGAISPTGMLVDGHRDPHQTGPPSPLLRGIGIR